MPPSALAIVTCYVPIMATTANTHVPHVDTDVVLGRDLTAPLWDLLPFNSWPVPLPMDDSP